MLKLQIGLPTAFRFLTGHDIRANDSAKSVKRRNETPFTDLHIEANRLKTFENWHVSFIDKHQLALLGFYFRGESDLVKCFFCGVEIGMWEEGDDVLTDHIRWAPTCCLMIGTDLHNIPINDAMLKQTLQQVPASSRGPIIPLNTTSEGTIDSLKGDEWPLHQSQFYVHTVLRKNLSSVSATPTILRPKYSDYAVEDKRIESYKQAPSIIRLKALELSDAGFYFTGNDDRVCCFSCGGGFKDWKDTDDPWKLHAIWYGKCEYLKLMKDIDFIEKVTKQREKIHRKVSWSSVQTVQKSLEKATCQSNEQFHDTNKKSDDEEVKKDLKLCKICYANDVNIVFLPCGHIIACAKCTSSLEKPKCPACCQLFDSVVKIYFS